MSVSKVISFRVNEQEQKILAKIMKSKNYKKKSKAIKAAITLMADNLE